MAMGSSGNIINPAMVNAALKNFPGLSPEQIRDLISNYAAAHAELIQLRSHLESFGLFN